MNDMPPVEGPKQFRVPYPVSEGSPPPAQREPELPSTPLVQPPATDQHTTALKIAKYGFAGSAVTAVLSLMGVIATGLFGLFTPAEATTAPQTVQAANCTVEQQNVISLIEKNPGWQFAYSGPAEEQCHLNDLVKSAPKPSVFGGGGTTHGDGSADFGGGGTTTGG